MDIYMTFHMFYIVKSKCWTKSKSCEIRGERIRSEENGGQTLLTPRVGSMASGNRALPQSWEKHVRDPHMRSGGKMYWSRIRSLIWERWSALSCCERSPALSAQAEEKGQGPEILCHWPSICRAPDAFIVLFSTWQSLIQLCLCPHPVSLVSVPTDCPTTRSVLGAGLGAWGCYRERMLLSRAFVKLWLYSLRFGKG